MSLISVGPAAIDRQVDAGDLARDVAGEEQAGIGDVVVGGDAPQRVVAGVALRRLLSSVMLSFFAMSAQTLSRKRGPSTMPGATQLTLMLCGPTSSAKLLVMPRRPHFEAE